ncbi:hypothetical protein V6N12_033072 [Hibiscus sabdariffa]|uniref:RNase H type-1 domain-containing protein n=1 Tax=Hibiscus sabdariffa TaxID=183260 RepID=A0ABR2BD30_9ROSI
MAIETRQPSVRVEKESNGKRKQDEQKVVSLFVENIPEKCTGRNEVYSALLSRLELKDYLFFRVHGALAERLAGCGGVLRTKDGILRALFSGPVEEISLSFAFLAAVKIALVMFRETGWVGKVSLVLELDCKVVLNWLENPLQCPQKWWVHLVEIGRLACKLNHVKFQYISRSENLVAFELAMNGLHRQDFFTAWW